MIAVPQVVLAEGRRHQFFASRRVDSTRGENIIKFLRLPLSILTATLLVSCSDNTTPEIGNADTSNRSIEDNGSLTVADIIPREYQGTSGTIPRMAIAKLEPTDGNGTRGVIAFIETDPGIRVTGRLVDLEGGSHGFHVHEVGDCSAPDASSAGGHFNIEGEIHAGLESEIRHVGDLGNIIAGNDNNAEMDFVDDKLTFSGPNSILGKAFIVHAGEDDLITQPSGDSGDRIACGVITAHES